MAVQVIHGLPFTRSYPLEEIGNVPRGVRLSFDTFGRLAVIHNGVYAVLNDTVWVDMADRTSDRGVIIANVVQGPDGRAYYGARGSWGTAELGANGRLRPVSLVPPVRPAWTVTNSFAEMVATDRGVYFAGWDGVVFWDVTRRECRFFEFSSINSLIRIGTEVFVSSHGRTLHRVDLGSGLLQAVPGTSFGGLAVDFATPLDDTHALLFVRDGRLMVFDGQSASEWPAQTRHNLTGTVSALQHLVDGGTALAITGRGLFFVSPEGELTSSLTAPQYHRISALATREPGVLWVAAEDTIEKVHYGSPLAEFGQRLGLPVYWPMVLPWRDQVVVASRGRLYEAIPGPPGSPSHFDLMKVQPAGGAWAAAVSGPRLLVGNATGVFAREEDERFTPVPSIKDVIRLVAVGPDLCFVIGQTDIAVLRWSDGRWAECAPRLPGIGYPTVIVHAARESVWIELGANKVGRLSLQNGELKLRIIEPLLGNDIQWVNVGRIDDLIVLSAASGNRAFFDEKTEQLVAAPELDRLLNRSPHWIIRVAKDDTGTLWAAHDEGVVTFTPKEGDYEIDSSTYDLINDRYPVVQVLPNNDVWFVAGRSLHHVEGRGVRAGQHPTRPQLVSVVDGKTNRELFLGRHASVGPLRLPFEQNSLNFRFFAGGYAWRRAPIYEFRLHEQDRWATLGSGSLLSFPGLNEGRYRLEVRFGGRPEEAMAPTFFEFEIAPPWHRTWFAYLGYGVTLVLLVVGVVAWFGDRARHRNLVLEQLVRERTRQLETTMAQLNEETRNAATFAERNRLAGEIHDSLQQGLSGAILQLDSTLKLPSVTGVVRSRLDVVRNMVSFTRHEVQHAVWDMESPLLADTELGEAIRKLTALINPGTASIEVNVSGTPVSLPSATKHHLLRIAQEATTNASRHANAQRISIHLEYRPAAVTLVIADDGVGFNPDEVLTQRAGHFGLRGLRGRARTLCGEISIQSSPGQGTTIRVTVPLTRPMPVVPDAQNRSN